jgi:probable rRNA maturation factor
MPTSDTPNPRPSRAPELALALQFDVQSATLPSRAKFAKWVRAALRKSACITLRVVGAREGRSLNRRFRRRDYATNVLTFVYSKRRPLEGDIAVCAPVVAREARALGIAAEAHYAHLTIHGVLHLQGYDHQHTAGALQMERLEARILKGLGYDDPYPNGRQEGPARAKRAA